MSARAIPTVYKGVQFRSRLEAKWAAFFDLLLWDWTYEPFDTPGWIPDFVVRGQASPFLVEVKPIGGANNRLLKDTHAKIIRARPEMEVLIASYELPRTDLGQACFGWLIERDQGEWIGLDLAVAGRWAGSERGSNPRHLIGFCADNGSYHDRITGCYDGGCCGGEGRLDHAYVAQLFALAGNTVQWRAP